MAVGGAGVGGWSVALASPPPLHMASPIESAERAYEKSKRWPPPRARVPERAATSTSTKPRRIVAESGEATGENRKTRDARQRTSPER